jgi:AraC family transcriptional regulator
VTRDAGETASEGRDAVVEGPTIETLEPMHLVGMHRPMSFAAPAVRELWRAFGPRVKEVAGRSSGDFVSMRVFAQPIGRVPMPDAPFEQWAAVEVEEPGRVPDGMESHTIAGGTYAVFTYLGRADAFEPAARHIYGEWLPASGYALDDREFFEVLGPGYRPDDPGATERIWVPVRPRDGRP